MSSWVYIFSQFTPEALLFEVLLISVLLCAYSAFWILKKRRMGMANAEVPSSVVKLYLSELIGDAEQMRSQLFGLLNSSSLPTMPQMGHAPGPGNVNLTQLAEGAASRVMTSDPDLVRKLAHLETKMTEQTQAIDRIQTEKAKLEQELTQARANGATAAAAAGTADAPAGDASGGDSKLQERVQMLEARLAEYSVIEDDLANLKRLQQENAQLKASLANAGTAAAPSPAAAAAPAPAAAVVAAAPTASAAPAEVVVPTIAPEAAEAAAPAPATPSASEIMANNPAMAISAEIGTIATTVAATAPAAAAAPATPNSPPTLDTNSFEGLVDEVEKSLQPDQIPSTPKAPAATVEKSDEDLIAEFEKMLNS